MRETNKKTVFVGVFHPFTTRNVLDAGVLDALKERVGAIYVFVLKEKEAYLRELYATEQVKIIGVDVAPFISAKRNVFFSRLAETLIDTRTKRNHQRAYLEVTGKRGKYIVARTFMFLASLPLISALLQWAERKAELAFNNPDVFGGYFRELKPDVALVTDPFAEADLLFEKSARKANVPDVAFVRSWDNLVNKTLLRIVPNLLIVQNDDMIEEAVRYHGIRRSIIRKGGVPQFEYYRRYKPKSREEFCRGMGIDPAKRIVIFSPAGKKYTDTDWEICEILKRQIREKRLPSDVHVLVRLHPQNFTDLSKFAADEHFTIEDPGVGLKVDRIKEIELSRENVDHLADELYHCELVINVISSIMIDAAVFDKPTVTIGFDGWETDVPFLRSVAREAGEEWLQVLFDSGLTPVARSEDELAGLINEFLEHPEKGKEVRARFVERHCDGLRGDAHERIADLTLSRAK